jgi:hypothetical protein
MSIAVRSYDQIAVVCKAEMSGLTGGRGEWLWAAAAGPPLSRTKSLRDSNYSVVCLSR